MKKFIVLLIIFSMVFAMSIPAFAENMQSFHDLDFENIYKAPIVSTDEEAFVGGTYKRAIEFSQDNDNDNVVLKYKLKDKNGRKLTGFTLSPYKLSEIKVYADGNEVSGSGLPIVYSGFKADEVELHVLGKDIQKNTSCSITLSKMTVVDGGSEIEFDNTSKWIENGTKYLLKASITNYDNAVIKVDINGTETDITSGHDGFGTIEKELSRYLFQDGSNDCKLIVIADNGERSEYEFTVTAPNSSGGDTGNDDTGNDDTGNDDSGNSGNTGSGILSINFNTSEMFTTSNMILASFMGLLTVIVGIAIGFRVVRFIKDLF